MAEFTNSVLQSVLTGQNVLFTETPVCSNNCNILHREGSGIVTLKGNTNQCRALYKVSFGGNIAVPTGGTPGAISIAIALEGEALASATATVTPAAVAEFFNVYTSVFVAVPKGCCMTVAVENVSTQTISVQNANLIVERVC